jgi:putative zinc finger protein
MDHREWADRKAAEGYVLDELSEVERDEFEDHFFGCEECAEEVRAAARFAANATAVFREDAEKVVPMPRPRPERPRNAGWQWAVAWAAAVAFAALSAYQSLVIIPRLSRPQVVAAITLLPATRGGEAAARAGKGAPFALLRFDINAGESFARYLCELRDASGAVVFSTEADPPAPGEPMTLLAPASKLAPGGHYALVLRGMKQPGEAGAEVDRYPFVFEK